MCTPAKFLLMVGMLLLSGCGSDDSTDALGGGRETTFDLEGNWIGETEDGILFDLRLQQTGAALGGDIGVEGTRTGIAGSINGDMVTFEANFSPVIFFDAELSPDGTQMRNGTMVDSRGTSANRFGAIKR